MADLAPLSTAIDAASLGGAGAIDGAAPARSVCGARAPGSRCVCGAANRCERAAEGDGLLPRVDDQPTVTGNGAAHIPDSLEADDGE